eukprot:CAMPEP_0202479946 /NCGR_PEP_ID=MMETSP1361-20130828/126_1 /ASSEMBLY_ACC=CAM_ASM_000849 /TAXON_ID=210615 /ORGANISM="Staurosira complex sp., Strain CCMP2646" /LENGTH=293 /DNA_ID=CAMNT_0049107321 /DNA_START=43 /DNA_END=924 /DNA_ORIENTATION=-
MASTKTILLVSMVCQVACLIPLIDGGNKMPKMFECYFNDQIAKQASTAVSKAITAGKKNIEVQFPPVPNLDEVRFGTPLNKKFGTDVVAKDLKVVGGYKPGSDVSRYLVSYSNVYWAKKIASATSGGILGGKPVCVLTAEQISFNTVKDLGDLSRSGKLMTQESRAAGRNDEAVIAINPGGEETWNRIVSAHGSPGAPFVVLNNAYSTTYGLGNQCNFEEAYYLKRISKGWVFRAFPGKWEAYLEKPDGSVELLKSYREKPELREVSALVRDESFKRFAINNDRFSKGFGERL